MKKDKKKRFVLIDGNALIHRAFHALPPLTTKKGELVNAVFGFTLVLLKAIRELKPTHIAVAFDAKGPTFRHKEFKEYKAHRQRAPKELYEQIPRIKQVINVFNIPSFEVSGFEADDIIGTLSEKVKMNNIIVTGDLDALQLVDKDTKVYTLRRGVRDTVTYDEKAVQERFGLAPKQLVDFKGLRGDPSDNIPGVPGVGEKIAKRLLQKFGSIEKMYQQLQKPGYKLKIKGIKDQKLKEKLLKFKDQAFLSKKLAKIVTDMPLRIDFKKCVVSDYDRNQVVKLFQELEFKTLLKRLPESGKSSRQSNFFEKIIERNRGIKYKEQNSGCSKMKNKKDPLVFYQLINTKEKLENFLKQLERLDKFAIDTETTSPKAHQAKLLGISFAWEEGKACYVQFPISPTTSNLSHFQFSKLRKVLENPKIRKIAHNAKYDLIVLKKAGIDLKGLDFDTMIASYVLNPGTRQHSLDNLVFTEFGYEMMSYEDLIGKKGKPIWEVDVKRLAFYSCEDADFTLRLAKRFKQELKKEKKLWDIFFEIEMPLILVLVEMELNGIKLDVQRLRHLALDFSKALAKLENEIYKEAGTRDFNINSTQQLARILYDKLKIPNGEVKKTLTGISTAASELAKLRKRHPIISLIEQYREYTKLKNTYIDTLPKLIDKKTNRVHTNFNQTITATGRLSSSDPNLQNIPVRTEAGRKIREAFCAEKGFKLLSADYSQIELRIMAHLSKDQNMVSAFEQDKDIHMAAAAQIFGKDQSDVSFEERRLAKMVNFGIMYGMSSYGLAARLGIEKEEAKKIIEKYFETFPAIALYIKRTLEFAKRHGFVETLFGRRRYLPELQKRKSASVERMAINHPIQGTAADIIKMAMNEIYQKNLVCHVDCRLLLQVHDELVFEIKEEKLKEFAQSIKEIMENIIKLCVPLKVDLAYGDNWGKLVKM